MSAQAAPRILLVRLSALGDVVHALPVLHALRDTWPGAHLGWLLEDRHAAILSTCSAIDRLHIVPRRAWKQRKLSLRQGLLELRRELRGERYQIAIDLQGLTKSGFWAWWSGARQRMGFAGADGRELNALFLTRRVQPPAAAVHVVDRNLALAHAVGATAAPARFDLPPDPAAAAEVAAWWDEFGLGERVAALLPGAGWATKQWPPSRFARLADRIAAETDLRALILWGPGEEAQAEAIRASARVPPALAPPTSIPALVEALRRCRVTVAGDTGPLHIAAALGVRCVALFGASDPRRNGPYGAGHVVATHPVACHPCWRTHCPTQIECLRDLDADMVFEQARAAGVWEP